MMGGLLVALMMAGVTALPLPSPPASQTAAAAAAAAHVPVVLWHGSPPAARTPALAMPRRQCRAAPPVPRRASAVTDAHARALHPRPPRPPHRHGRQLLPAV